jgi:hypothetical protein
MLISKHPMQSVATNTSPDERLLPIFLTVLPAWETRVTVVTTCDNLSYAPYDDRRQRGSNIVE